MVLIPAVGTYRGLVVIAAIFVGAGVLAFVQAKRSRRLGGLEAAGNRRAACRSFS